MVNYVIDTNIPIVANGKDETIKVSCRLAAVEILLKAISNGKIFIDDGGDIQGQYRRHMNPRGQPGIGDRFYLEVINSHPGIVERVNVPKNDENEYIDVPQPIINANFDPSDRVFVAVANKSKSMIYNAVDSDWLEHRDVIEENGIKIAFVCGCNANNWRAN